MPAGPTGERRWVQARVTTQAVSGTLRTTMKRKATAVGLWPPYQPAESLLTFHATHLPRVTFLLHGEDRHPIKMADICTSIAIGVFADFVTTW